MKMFFKKSIAIIICICMFFCAVPMSRFFDYNFSGLFNTTANALAVPPGYEFGGYDDDGNPIYVAGKVQYAVDIYMMNINGEYGEPVQKIFYDYADAVVTYVPEIPVGYFLNSEKSVLEATVLADGATVLRVYLDRMINCNLIYGFFHAWLTEDEVIDYLKDEYGGYIEAGYNEYEPYAGTGACFYRYDSIDAEESTGTYWVVIFGDVNGDSQINSADVKAIEDELAGATIWSVSCLVFNGLGFGSKNQLQPGC